MSGYSFISGRQQPNPRTQAVTTEQWQHILLSYARHRKLFYLRVEDAETPGGDWDEVLRNERIKRELCHTRVDLDSKGSVV